MNTIAQFLEKNKTFCLISFVLNVYGSIGVTGKDAEVALDRINITLNKNQIPNDELPPLKSSGVRIGTPAMTTKGWKEKDFEKLATVIMDALTAVKEETFEEKVDEFKAEVAKIIKEAK